MPTPQSKFPSIKALVLDFVQHHDGKVDYAELTREVLHHFPESKWKPTHWSYWRYQILHSALADQFTPETLANLKVGVQKAPSIIPPELPKPTWPNLIELEQHNIAKALARVTHHMHPKVIARIREINADHDERARLETILPECIERVAWLYPGTACVFPAVRVAYFKRHIELYGEDCLPGLRTLDPEAMPGWYGDLEWNEPILPSGWEENVKKLMKFRYCRLAQIFGNLGPE